ncbi:MAG: serine hydroxymethyltransferase, partial [Chloroflexia bacterium]|nr:serine hydroxymethyltransferase [Chloroflexia bacterium]
MILCAEEHAKTIDKAVFPGLQGGPLMHVIAGKAVAFNEALSPEFGEYSARVIENARAMAEELMARGVPVISGGTDTHLMLVDVGSRGLSGSKAEKLLDAVGITSNKNTIPGDTRSPAHASGIRLGTPAVTTRGFGPVESRMIAGSIADLLADPGDEALGGRIADQVRELMGQFPLSGLERSA